MTLEKQLEQNLQLITTFHYIVAGLGALMGCFPILHLTIGLSFLFGDPIPESPDEPFPMRLFGLMFTLIPLLIMLSFWGYSILTAMSGYYIQQRQRRTFSIVMAAINCAFFPFGTVLGVFTILLLNKPEATELYQLAEGQPLNGS
ncbi:MAG: hypothetical protein IPL28_14565 [Chloroflexi bacterium]|nr:hypothetical protein [Chloroflexota bacterium]